MIPSRARSTVHRHLLWGNFSDAIHPSLRRTAKQNTPSECVHLGAAGTGCLGAQGTSAIVGDICRCGDTCQPDVCGRGGMLEWGVCRHGGVQPSQPRMFTGTVSTCFLQDPVVHSMVSTLRHGLSSANGTAGSGHTGGHHLIDSSLSDLPLPLLFFFSPPWILPLGLFFLNPREMPPLPLAQKLTLRPRDTCRIQTTAELFNLTHRMDDSPCRCRYTLFFCFFSIIF